MKIKRIIAILLISMLTLSLTACGKKAQDAENVGAETTENNTDNTQSSSTEVDTQTAQTTQPTDTNTQAADAAMAVYNAFLNGEELFVHFDLDRLNFPEYWKDSGLITDEYPKTFTNFIGTMFLLENSYSPNGDIGDVSYAFIDAGDDGVPELAIKATFTTADGFIDEDLIVLKANDGNLVFRYFDQYGYRTFTEVANKYGKIVNVGSYSYSTSGITVGYLDKDCNYNYCYNEITCWDAASMFFGIEYDSAPGSDNPDYSNLYARCFTFEPYNDKLSDAENEANSFYCYEKYEDDPTNGVDFEENKRILTEIFDGMGKKLYSQAEIDVMIAEKEKALGITDNMRSKDEPTWTTVPSNEDWDSYQLYYGDDPFYSDEEPKKLPGDMTDMPYSAGTPYNANNYTDLTAGTFNQTELDQTMECISDMLAYDFYDLGIPEHFRYGEALTQCLIYDWDDYERVTSVNVFTGNTEMDKVMAGVGYKNYELTYYYTFGPFRAAGANANDPVYAKLTVGGDTFEYVFGNGGLVRRYGKDGNYSDDPEPNAFINELYKRGCYYGNVLQGEEGHYCLFVYSPEAAYEVNGAFALSCSVQGYEGDYRFTIDNDTIFYPGSTEFMEGYEPGDTPVDWLTRVTGDIETYQTAIVGIFDVQLTGDHIDGIYGIYWWD